MAESTLRAMIEDSQPALVASLAITDARWSRLEALAELWLRYGRVMNLTAARSIAELAPHIIEGMQVVDLVASLGISEGARWLDVGSGAGFPALIVAALSDVELTLIEPRERRAAFLEVALAQVGRRQRVLRGHLDESGWRPLGGERGTVERGSFDVASARAVFPPPRWLEIARGWVKPGGLVVAHLTREAPDVAGWSSSDLRNFDRWSVRAYRVGALAAD